MRRPSGISWAFAVAIVVSSVFEATRSIELGHTNKNAEQIAARSNIRQANGDSLENDKSFWINYNKGLLDHKIHKDLRQYGTAKNIIFFLGDGMSITTLTAARIYMGQMQNRTGENESLSFEKFPNTGLSKTYCVDRQVADSACTATAYLTGTKGNIETIGVTGAVSDRDCVGANDPTKQTVSSMLWAQKAGKRTGVVSNMRVTHATPAGAYANVANRDWECDNDVKKDSLAHSRCANEAVDIARQLIEKETGRNLNVIMGGGRSKFLPNTTSPEGQRRDNRNLVEEWKNIERFTGAHKAYVEDRSQLNSVNTNETDYLFGLFTPSHMNFNLLANKTKEPTLVEMTEAAIKVLSKGENGFYLFIEGGQIDTAHHFNLAHLSLDETVMFSKAVERAYQMTSRRDTLIVVTSDHSHTMTISGYPHRGSNIFGHSEVSDMDNMPYSTLSYANGPSANASTTGIRYNLTGDNTEKWYWTDYNKGLLKEKLYARPRYGTAKNVIMFVGEGMSISTLTAARIYMGQLDGNEGENEVLEFEKYPNVGLSKTYCLDSQVADSACSATAYLSGIKGNMETIGMTGAVSKRDCVVGNDPAKQTVSSMLWAQRAGKRTGVVTNMRVTHATPAATYANVAQRDWECDKDMVNDPLADPRCLKETSDIARQLIEGETGRNLNVIMGGGRLKLLPNTTLDCENKYGERLDNRNLIEEWMKIDRFPNAGKIYIDRGEQLFSDLHPDKTDYLLGLFASSHLNYSLLANNTKHPRLVEMVWAAIKVLSKSENGYYLFVEGGLIDRGHHENKAHLALDETVELSWAVKQAYYMTSREDTLIVVTSDHSHTMTMSGYPERGNNIFGHSGISDTDKMPYSTLSYANGPSAYMLDTGNRYNLTNDNSSDFEYAFPSMVKLTSATHGGEDVAVFAVGPWAHLFVGNYEQTFIPYAIGFAAKIGPYFTNGPSQHSGSLNSVPFVYAVIFCTLVSLLTF
ncbi:Alkaline-phosphatase-like, core domain,Alkaline phosphatase-like, alpha/beta/alpha,Alkaline [Cinara cedri]|uniref:Alkaline phosphatase n=1 Tax=Cinara cedri TaxID=506608 RepID=A0A5E4MID9_9HEMI|nr:Alkaline-phosphatase-like, core domain,Alkaline phosphatase-like, alpha/beta/alpha,Alkaline [Cinara cedri]